MRKIKTQRREANIFAGQPCELSIEHLNTRRFQCRCRRWRGLYGPRQGHRLNFSLQAFQVRCRRCKSSLYLFVGLPVLFVGTERLFCRRLIFPRTRKMSTSEGASISLDGAADAPGPRQAIRTCELLIQIVGWLIGVWGAF